MEVNNTLNKAFEKHQESIKNNKKALKRYVNAKTKEERNLEKDKCDILYNESQLTAINLDLSIQTELIGSIRTLDESINKFNIESAKSSARQRTLTRAIIFIGAVSLLASCINLLKAFEII